MFCAIVTHIDSVSVYNSLGDLGKSRSNKLENHVAILVVKFRVNGGLNKN